MNETVNLRYEPVGEGQFPLLGKVYAEAWKGSSSAFAPSAYRKKQPAEKAAERVSKTGQAGEKPSLFPHLPRQGADRDVCDQPLPRPDR